MKKNKNPSYKKKKTAPTKEKWCICTAPRFNGDNLDPRCTVCNGMIE